MNTSSAAQDLLIFIGIFILMFIVWVSTGGPARYISQAGPYLDAPAPIGTGQPYGTSTVPTGFVGLGGANFTLPDYDPNSGVKESSVNIPRAEFSESSPLVPHSTFPGSTLQASRTPDTEFVTIRIPTGMTLSSADGLAFEDDLGNRKALPLQGSTLVSQGTLPPLENMTFTASDTLIITSGRSPLGTSFRVNKCSGYLGQFQNFVPPLTLSCPLPKTEISAACAPQANTLTACRSLVDAAPLLKSGATPACVNEVQTKLTYGGCVALHKNDPEFATHEWRIFLGSNALLWNKSSSLSLINRSGQKLVSLRVGSF